MNFDKERYCNLIISNVSVKNENDTMMFIDNKTTLNNYTEAVNKLYDGVFNRQSMSTYNEEHLNIDDLYTVKAIQGYLINSCDLYDAIDIRKCYTSGFSEIDTVPVFEYFDDYKKYDGSKIEPYNKYIIKLLSGNDVSKLMFKNLINRCYGFKLMNLPPSIEYEIIYFIRPSKLHYVNYKTLVDELYDSKIDNEDDVSDAYLKKMSCNVIT